MQAGAVVLGPPACPNLDRQACGAQRSIECPARRVDGSRVCEWLFGLCLYLREAKLCGCLAAFLLVAWPTRQGEVGYAVRAAASPGDDMLDLEWHRCRPAIGTG